MASRAGLREQKSQKAEGIPAKRDSTDNRRRQLIEIAFNEIAAKGFEGLRFQEVATAAGITNATLYYYFPSKEILIQALVDSLMKELSGFSEGVKRSAESALEQLRGLFEEVRRRVTDDPRFFIVITELALRARRDPVIDNIGKQRDDSWERRLRTILERGVADGSFRKNVDVDAMVIALIVQMKGIGHHAAVRKRKTRELDRVIDEIASQVEHWLVHGVSRKARPLS